MKEELISFKTAKLAKEKGINLLEKNHIGYYDSNKVYDCDGTLCSFDFDANPYANKLWYVLRKLNSLDRNDIKNKREFKIVDHNTEPVIEIYCAVTQSLLQKWLRENHKIHIELKLDEEYWKPELYSFHNGNKHIPTGFKYYPTYEEALENGLILGLNHI